VALNDRRQAAFTPEKDCQIFNHFKRARQGYTHRALGSDLSDVTIALPKPPRV